jgi:hypothetical protein
MSLVTNAILHLGVLDEDEEVECLAAVNRYFKDRPGFVLVADDWCGGSKNLECSLAIGAFNYMGLDGLLKHMRSMSWPWYDRENVQLLVKEQDDDKFRVIDVFADEPLVVEGK